MELSDSFLDKLVLAEIKIRSKTWPAFKFFIYTGVLFGVALAHILVFQLDLSISIMALISATAISAVVVQITITKIFTGEERSAFYHEFILVVTTTSILLWILNKPILPYLDLTVLAVASIQIIGRIGCFMAGCCHGRPYHWGICYGREHAKIGFTPAFVGVRFFPIQLVEALWTFCITFIGIFLILNSNQPGTALAWYGITYGLGRFCFEFLRGDERPYYGGFSRPQWISLFLMVGVVWAELADILAFHGWHVGVTAFVILIMICVSLRRRFRKTPKHELLHPCHVKEVAEAVELASNHATTTSAISQWNSQPREIH